MPKELKAIVKDSVLYHEQGDFSFFIDELEGGGHAIKCVPNAKGYFHAAYATREQAATVLDRMIGDRFDYMTYKVNFSASNPVIVFDMNSGKREYIYGAERAPCDI